jgi:hypothetical protein
MDMMFAPVAVRALGIDNDKTKCSSLRSLFENGM